MPPKQKYSDPKLRDEVKEEIKQGDNGGEPGQWSARKAQMMAKEYKKRGGDYNTPKSSRDESQKALDKWGDEDWQTKEGSREAKQDDGSRKRYLPKKAWEQMSEKEKKETDEKKQNESQEGKQYVNNTGEAKNARKEVAKEDDDDHDEEEEEEKEQKEEKQKTTAKNQSMSKSQTQTSSKHNSRNDTKSQKQEKKDESADDGSGDNKSDKSEEKENESPSKGRKRTRKQQDDGEDEQDQKKQKTSRNDGKTIGSKHDKATPPAKQGSNSRLPKKGQKNVHWKSMPGWVEGEVVEIVRNEKEVNGKNIKASKDKPMVVLKSKSSGKICVHKADNVYFD